MLVVLGGNLDDGTVPRRRAWGLRQWRPGELDAAMDDITIEHGFGTLRTGAGGVLEAPSGVRMV